MPHTIYVINFHFRGQTGLKIELTQPVLHSPAQRWHLTCPSQVTLDDVKPILQTSLHVVDIVQHGPQRAVHALQFVHQVTVVVRRLVLVLQKLQPAAVCLQHKYTRFIKESRKNLME